MFENGNEERKFEQHFGKDYGDKMPYDIERLKSDTDDYYSGFCAGAENVFSLAKAGCFKDEGIEYVDEPFEEDDEYDGCECEDCDCFDEIFDLGYKKGFQASREEIMDDIFIDGRKIDRIEAIRQKVLALGRSLTYEHIGALNEIVNDLTNLLKATAFEAVEEYLGYK